MKQIILFLSVFCVTVYVSAQRDYSEYLDTVMVKLKAGDCNAAQKFYNVYKDLTGNTKSSIEVLIEDCIKEKEKKEEKPKSKIDLTNNSYCDANKNRYVAWGIAGAGYPWKLITSIEFRGGNVIGVGLYGDIGMDFTNIEYKRYYYDGSQYGLSSETTLKTSFRYAGGIKFYPYRGLFIDCGYGTIAQALISLTDGNYNESSAKKAVKSSHGILFHAGYNLVTDLDLSSSVGFFFGVSGGGSYDVVSKVLAPSVYLKLGIAWGWEK